MMRFTAAMTKHLSIAEYWSGRRPLGKALERPRDTASLITILAASAVVLMMILDVALADHFGADKEHWEAVGDLHPGYAGAC